MKKTTDQKREALQRLANRSMTRVLAMENLAEYIKMNPGVPVKDILVQMGVNLEV